MQEDHMLNIRLPIMVDAALLAAIDEWRRAQPDLPSRGETIRRVLRATIARPPKVRVEV